MEAYVYYDNFANEMALVHNLSKSEQRELINSQLLEELNKGLI